MYVNILLLCFIYFHSEYLNFTFAYDEIGCFPLLMSIAGVLVVIKVFELHSVLRDSVLKMLFD